MPGENQSHVRPRVVEDLLDDLSVEISRVMQRRGLRLRDLQDLGYSRDRVIQISQYLRGVPASRPMGHIGALRLAERLGIRVAFQIGDEVHS